MGFDYELQYTSEAENLVADAISRVLGFEILLMALSTIQSNLMSLIEQTWLTDPTLQLIIQQKQQDPNAFSKFQWFNGQLRSQGKLIMGDDPSLKAILLQWMHNSQLEDIQVEMPH